ncbi:MAG TPA: hypothetical protein VF584_16840 [Longimicrobium sp.]|jgi:hypothetical protein
MTKPGLKMVSAIAILALGVGGCQAGEESEARSGKETARAADRPILAPAPAAAAVARMLYEENLVSVPEVSERTKEAVLRVARDNHSRDSVMPALHRWLENWAAAHPVEAKAARLAGGNSKAQAHGTDAHAPPSVRAQTDSIRLLVRIRARRRIEAARLAHDLTGRHAGTE